VAGKREDKDLTAITVFDGTAEARALQVFLALRRTPKLRQQFITGWPHTVPRFWITEGQELLASKDGR